MEHLSMEITMLDISLIAPNRYNPNVIGTDVLAKLRSEIAGRGMCEPILVRIRGDGYEIIDGEHRWQICKELGWKDIPCIIVDYDDNEAKIKTLQLNYMRGSAVPIKLAYLIHDLNKEIKLEDLAKRLPYEEPQLIDSLELLKLPEDLDKTVEAQALAEEEELPLVLSFVVYKAQAETIEQALNFAIKSIKQDQKNIKALALVKICAQYLEQEEVTKEPEAAKEKKEES